MQDHWDSKYAPYCMWICCYNKYIPNVQWSSKYNSVLHILVFQERSNRQCKLCLKRCRTEDLRPSGISQKSRFFLCSIDLCFCLDQHLSSLNLNLTNKIFNFDVIFLRLMALAGLKKLRKKGKLLNRFHKSSLDGCVLLGNLGWFYI